jgi:hypothetical protein
MGLRDIFSTGRSRVNALRRAAVDSREYVQKAFITAIMRNAAVSKSQEFPDSLARHLLVLPEQDRVSVAATIAALPTERKQEFYGLLRKSEEMEKGATSGKPKSWVFDPISIGWTHSGDVPSLTHPGTLGLDYGTLMTVARLPWFGAIIQTRIQQSAEFAQPQPSPYSVGFRVRLRDRRKDAGREDRKESHRIERMLMRAGGKYQPGGLDCFMRMLVRDSLSYDQGNYEPIFKRGGKPWGFMAVDASTIRRAKPTKAMLDRGQWDPDRIGYVQVVNDKVVNEYGRYDMAWGIRRPRTWLFSSGYGFPELEELLSIVTDLLNAQSFNSANFRTGIHAQSVFVLQAALDDDAFRAFKRSLEAMLHGPRNSKRTPMIQLDPGYGEGMAREDLKVLNLSQSNKEMEYAKWMDYLLKIACACYQMDPAELGFVYGNEGQTSALAQQGPADRIWASKERGLRPLLRSIQTWLNDWFVYKVNPDFMMEFVGFDSLSESAKLDNDIKALRSYKKLNEVRVENSLDPIDGWIGELVLDPTYYQAYTMLRQEEQQQEQEAMMGGPEGGGMMGGPEAGMMGPEGGGMMGGPEAGMMGGPMQGPMTGAENVEAMTQSLTKTFLREQEEGRLLHASSREPRGPWIPVPTRKSGSVQAYVKEVPV